MKIQTLTHVDLFSGIGGFRHGAALACINRGVEYGCLAHAENDKHALKSYSLFYETSGSQSLGDVSTILDDTAKIEKIKGANFLTAGFPCQPFSTLGKLKGFEDYRGGAFFDILKIIQIIKPTIVLLENVRNILTHNKGGTILEIVSSLKKCGYTTIKYSVFNTSNFGLPQTRSRVYIVATNLSCQEFEFSEKVILDTFLKNPCENVSLYKTINDILQNKVSEKYYLSKQIKPTILSHGTGGFVSKSEINQKIARPICATMGKMHRACQDNYYSDKFIDSNGEVNDSTAPWEQLLESNIRRITPIEAFLLQGFPEAFVRKAIEHGVSDFQLYKQAGNAVSVNVVAAIVGYLLREVDIYNHTASQSDHCAI